MSGSLLYRIANRIREDYIDNGALKPGDQLPTVRELVERYTTSRGTVIHALSLLEQQGIVDKRRGAGCFVSQESKRDIVPAPPKMIGFVRFHGGSSEIPVRMQNGVERVCLAYGYNLVTSCSSRTYEEEYQQVKRMAEIGCRGVVLYPVARTKEQLRLDYLKREFLDLPIVLLDEGLPEQKRSQVVFDNYNAGFGMTQMLIREGHSRIAFMKIKYEDNQMPDSSANRQRYQGYLEALRIAGITPHDDYVWDISPSYGFHLIPEEVTYHLNRWREQKERPTAVLAVEDATVMVFASMAVEMGISVPYELKFVGFDNLEVGRSYRPAFATTAPDFELAGETATRILIQQVNGILDMQGTYIHVLPTPITYTYR